MIESYNFGRMVIDKKVYASDLIIYSDRIEASRWRRSGHRLYLIDMEHILQEKPEVVVIGTGFMGVMKVEDEVKQHIQKIGISLSVEKTQKAIQTFNTFSSQKKDHWCLSSHILARIIHINLQGLSYRTT